MEEPRINITKLANPANYTKGRLGCQVEALVIHYTDGKGNARENAEYFSRDEGQQGSAHYFVDDEGIYASVPEDDTAWAVGNLQANARTISIEVCSNGEDFTTAEMTHLQRLVCALMDYYGFSDDKVIRHYDAFDYFSPRVSGGWIDPRKCCPAPYAPNGSDPTGAKWRALHKLITDPTQYVQAAEDPASGEVVRDDGEKASSSIVLDVDGYWGTATTRRLQEYLKAKGCDIPAIDGEIWSQYEPYVDANPGLTSGWVCSDAPKGSPTIHALQSMLSGVGYHLDIDGIMGKVTTTCLQLYLGMSYCDGKFDGPSPCVRKMQQRLNEGSL